MVRSKTPAEPPRQRPLPFGLCRTCPPFLECAAQLPPTFAQGHISDTETAQSAKFGYLSVRRWRSGRPQLFPGMKKCRPNGQALYASRAPFRADSITRYARHLLGERLEKRAQEVQPGGRQQEHGVLLHQQRTPMSAHAQVTNTWVPQDRPALGASLTPPIWRAARQFLRQCRARRGSAPGAR